MANHSNPLYVFQARLLHHSNEVVRRNGRQLLPHGRDKWLPTSKQRAQGQGHKSGDSRGAICQWRTAGGTGNDLTRPRTVGVNGRSITAVDSPAIHVSWDFTRRGIVEGKSYPLRPTIIPFQQPLLRRVVQKGMFLGKLMYRQRNSRAPPPSRFQPNPFAVAPTT